MVGFTDPTKNKNDTDWLSENQLTQLFFTTLGVWQVISSPPIKRDLLSVLAIIALNHN